MHDLAWKINWLIALPNAANSCVCTRVYSTYNFVPSIAMVITISIIAISMSILKLCSMCVATGNTKSFIQILNILITLK